MKEFDLLSHLRPVCPAECFEMEGYWVWCGSAIQGEDGRYHLFAARWSKDRPFFSGYIFTSEIVHAVSNTPYGPFTYVNTALPDRGEEFWDGRMTHNPTIYKYGDTYYLFYIGATYSGECPDGTTLLQGHHPKQDTAYATIRIGMATAKSVYGPWVRQDHPVLTTSENSWDNLCVTNPSACFLEDGTIFLYYRSNTSYGLRIGLAKGNVKNLQFIKHPYPIIDENLEDHFIWHNGTNFEMIAKDVNGTITGCIWGGAHFVSADGIHWQKASNPVAYTRTLKYEDGTERSLYHFERPCLLIENGKPKCLYAAVGEEGSEALPYESRNFAKMKHSKNQVVRIE